MPEEWNDRMEEYRRLAKKQLGEKRYAHTLAVSRLAGELAQAYGEPVADAQMAGLLHDITKEMPVESQLQTIQKSDILYDKTLLLNPNVYHALTAFLYARDVLGISNGNLLNAIRYHTTGRAGMSLLEKIVYVADAVSYDRTYAGVGQLRELAFENLNEAALEILRFNLEKLLAARQPIAVDTIFCYNDIYEQIRLVSADPHL